MFQTGGGFKKAKLYQELMRKGRGDPTNYFVPKDNVWL